jgi:hypothetical protein
MLPEGMFGGSGGSDPNSGIQEMIRNSATLQEIEGQKPAHRDAELQLWEIIKRWHNLLHDKRELTPRMMSLGKFSEDFSPNIVYRDMKPVESDEAKQSQVKFLLEEGLITRRGALKKLNPEMKDEQIDALLLEINQEKAERAAAFGLAMSPAPKPVATIVDDTEEEEDVEDEQKG